MSETEKSRSTILRRIAIYTAATVLLITFTTCSTPATVPLTPLPTDPLQSSDAPIPSSTPGVAATPTPEPTPLPRTSLPTDYSRLSNTSIPALTPDVPATPTPEPTPLPTDLVWFAPNFGSRDFLDLFTQPDLWSAARSKIDVFKFYTQSVLDSPCRICGPNTYRSFVNVDAFQKLTDWGIPISVEVGAVKEWGCTGAEEFRVAAETIRNIEANGGAVAFLDMDEPYLGGEHVFAGSSCGLTMEQSADVTARFIREVEAAYPNILVGDTEPYPYFSVAQLERWIVALETRGVTLAHFHLDADMVRAHHEGLDVSTDLRTLNQFLHERMIPFGVILTSNSNWTPSSDRAFFEATMEWARIVNAAIGKPQHVIFQSWLGPSTNAVHEVPANLPEDDPSIYSHARLILDGLDAFSP